MFLKRRGSIIVLLRKLHRSALPIKNNSVPNDLSKGPVCVWMCARSQWRTWKEEGSRVVIEELEAERTQKKPARSRGEEASWDSRGVDEPRPSKALAN